MLEANGKYISIESILDAINCNNNVISIIAYQSHMDGLGNKHSDVDLYVITHCNQNILYDWDYVCTKIKCIYIEEVKFDIEYWELSTLQQTLEDIHNNVLVIDNLKLKVFPRLYVGKCIYGEPFKGYINYNELQEYIIFKNRLLCRSFYDDAVRFFDVGDYVSAMNSNSLAVIFAMTGINAMNGTINLQPKWAARLFINSSNVFIVNQYLNTFVFINVSESSIPNIVQNQLETLNYILSLLDKT